MRGELYPVAREQHKTRQSNFAGGGGGEGGKAAELLPQQATNNVAVGTKYKPHTSLYKHSLADSTLPPLFNLSQTGNEMKISTER